MNPQTRSTSTAGKLGVAAIFVAVVICTMIVSAVLVVQGSIRRQMRWTAELSSTGMSFATDFATNVKAGNFDKAREAASPSYRAKLTDEALRELQAKFASLTFPPATLNTRMQKGQSRFQLGTHGFAIHETPSVLTVDLGLEPPPPETIGMDVGLIVKHGLAPAQPPEEISIDVTYESNRMVIVDARRGVVPAPSTSPATPTTTSTLQATVDASIRR